MAEGALLPAVEAAQDPHNQQLDLSRPEVSESMPVPWPTASLAPVCYSSFGTEPTHSLLRCVQEIESAVHHKLLPTTFRTSLCSTALSQGAACPLGQRCCNAHSVRELRVDAAIKLKYLPVDYKLTLCDSFCSYGARLLLMSGHV